MKGVVFTEFLELVENKFGLEVLDTIIEAADLPSAGAYTAVGTYPHGELVQLVTELSKTSGVDARELVRGFGTYLFDSFLKNYPQFFAPHTEVFSFLESVDEHIHVEVRKLYQDAELPRFESRRDGDTLRLRYASDRGFDALALGLIEASIAYFQERVDIETQDHSEGCGRLVDFVLTKKS